MSRKLIGLVAGLTLLGLSGPAYAVPINLSFQGTLAGDDSVQLFVFEAGTAPVRLLSLGYGGGTQQDGTAVSAGGFDTFLSVFDSTGVLIAGNDDSGFGPNACGGGVVNADPNNGETFDSCLDLVLAAGTYTVAISLADNFSIGPNLTDGFAETGDPFYTAGFYGCTNGQFCDGSGSNPYDNRTGAFALDVIVVASEPGALGLFAFGLVGLGFMTRRRKP